MDKAEVKMLTLHEVGCRVDDMLDGAQQELCRLEGGVVAITSAKKAIEQLSALVSDDVTKQRYDESAAAKIKEYIERCMLILAAQQKRADFERVAAHGKITALKTVVDAIKKEHAAEQGKLGKNRVSPAPGLKKQRGSQRGKDA
jgi:hypothetical protein